MALEGHGPIYLRVMQVRIIQLSWNRGFNFAIYRLVWSFKLSIVVAYYASDATSLFLLERSCI